VVVWVLAVEAIAVRGDRVSEFAEGAGLAKDAAEFKAESNSVMGREGVPTARGQGKVS
jgi:hypothetical protein